MGGIEDDAETLHLFQQLVALGCERAFIVGAMPVDPRAIVDGSYRDQSVGA